MKPILDATAGNRAMHKNKNPPHTVFMDKEYGLSRPPHIFGVWQLLPFRDKVFSTLYFDPPHERFGKNSVHMNPKGWAANRFNAEGKRIGGTWWDSLPRGWAGIFYKAQKEFARVSDILCFKWNTSKFSLERVLLLFEDWVEIYRKNHKSKMRRGKSKTWWVTFESS